MEAFREQVVRCMVGGGGKQALRQQDRAQGSRMC